jgi:hypothetical protein
MFERVSTIAPDSSGPQSCSKVLAGFSTGASARVLKEIADVDVASLRVQGRRGFVIYRDAHGRPFVIPMVREAGGWKVAALGGGPLR